MTLLSELKTHQNAFFKIRPILNSNYKKLKVDCIYSLLFIIHFLEERGVTLTHICLTDFEVSDQYLYLIKDIHIVELIDDHYIYESRAQLQKIGSYDFMPQLSHNNHKSQLYRSVGLFMFWILTHINKEFITEKDLEPYFYTKPYFFIKNTMEKIPCLIYL